MARNIVYRDITHPLPVGTRVLLGADGGEFNNATILFNDPTAPEFERVALTTKVYGGEKITDLDYIAAADGDEGLIVLQLTEIYSLGVSDEELGRLKAEQNERIRQSEGDPVNEWIGISFRLVKRHSGPIELALAFACKELGLEHGAVKRFAEDEDFTESLDVVSALQAVFLTGVRYGRQAE